jgi:CheY-like chemotaxis protein/HPt (histidine-containing phosphotransfer) domain-containing protein
MNSIQRLFEQFKAYHAHGRPIVQYTGMVGIAAYPLFYLLRLTKADPPYNDLGLRVVAVLICIGLALRNHWPRRLQPYYLAYAYAALLYCMPFFFIFSSLNNGGGSVAVSNTFVAVFFLILLSDWRNTVLMLVVGAAAAVLLYITVVPNPVLPMDYVARLPMLVLVVVGGSLFKFAEKQAEAEKVKRTYTALAGSIAHEMRNPLSQIKHSLEGMQQALPSPATAALDQSRQFTVPQVDALYRHLAESELAVKRGLQVIAMTLDEVSEKPMDAGSFSYVSAAEATHKAVEEYGYESDAERARVVVRVIEDFSFRGDETAYLFVLFNLLKNALYYVALYPQALVTITIEPRQVKVRDTGPGIPPRMLPGLFEPFRSEGKSGGTGLGLAYCQRVMRGFGGQIGCESAEGEYAEFTLRFPPICDEEREAHRFAALERARTALAGKRLLIVDDDAAQRITTHHKLKGVGAAIDEAANGQRALEMLAAQPYDLVLLDLNMPLVDGYAVAEKIRKGQASANPDVRIVAHTSEPAHLASVKTQKAGMDGFVGKPCAQLPLLEALQQAMAHRVTRGEPDATLLAGRRILLADDNRFNRLAVAAYLQHAGATVVEAPHGPAVLAQLPTCDQWDAILMDINMPGMNGLETTLAIRSSEMAWRNIPIVALTAHSDDETVRAAQAAGMNDFITKPVEAAILYAKLGQLIAGRFPVPAAVSSATRSAAAGEHEGELLNLERLESFRRIGMLEELLDDYIPEISRLVTRLERSVEAEDLEESIDAMHSLLGMSGEPGAQALHRLVRRFYVPMVEARDWPPDDEWLARIKTAAALAEEALRAYCPMQEVTAG